MGREDVVDICGDLVDLLGVFFWLYIVLQIKRKGTSFVVRNLKFLAKLDTKFYDLDKLSKKSDEGAEERRKCHYLGIRSSLGEVFGADPSQQPFLPR